MMDVDIKILHPMAFGYFLMPSRKDINCSFAAAALASSTVLEMQGSRVATISISETRIDGLAFICALKIDIIVLCWPLAKH